jgi:serine/threonine protein kinase
MPFALLENYEILAKVGHGGFGSVFKAYDSRTNTSVAIKQIQLHPGPRDALDKIPAFARREIDVGERFSKNPTGNICRLIEHIHLPERHELFLVFKYYPFDVTSLVRNCEPSLRRSVHFARSILRALAAMHAAGFVHRDVKPENVLVGHDGSVVLADFGLARELRRQMTDGVGTHFYRTPEQLLGATDYGTAVDMWALGCVLYYIAMGEDLFTKRVESDLFAEMSSIMGTPTTAEWPEMAGLPNTPLFLSRKTVTRDLRQVLRERMGDANEAYIDLIARMLTWNPNDRITAAEALKHRVFAEVRGVWIPEPIAEQHQGGKIVDIGMKCPEEGLDIDISFGRFVPSLPGV